ncbi:chemotaxis protein CheW [Myxococcota bacterium]|nr:chemotaxis protein CheW [Myxococcota bacterium]
MSTSATSTNREKILKARAQKYALASKREQDLKSTLPVAIFTLGEERFGIEMKHLGRIGRAPAITHLPNLPPWFSGIAHIRGSVLSVVDMGLFLDLGASKGDFWAILEGKEGVLGALFDGVEGFRDIASSDFAHNLETHGNASQSIIKATTTDLISILDIDAILSSNRVYVTSRQRGVATPNKSPILSSAEANHV